MLLRERRINVLSRVSQWYELRGFERLYDKNPEAQAKFVSNLLAMAAFESTSNDSNGSEVVSALETIVTSFTSRHSEYLQAAVDLSGLDLGPGAYEADPMLVDQIVALMYEQKLKLSALDGESFEKLYEEDPYFQVCFIEGLLGLRAVHTEFGPIDDNSVEVIKAIDTVVIAYTNIFSDYLGEDAHPEDILLRKVNGILKAQHAA